MDDEDYDPMSIEDRVAAEQELRRRDREETFGRRGDDALIYGTSLEVDVHVIIVTRPIICRFFCRRKR